MTNRPWFPINAEENSAAVPLVAKVGGIAVGAAPIAANVELPQLASFFVVGDLTGVSDVVLEDADGNAVPFYNVQPGQVITLISNRVLLVGAGTGTTTTKLTWCGGV